MLILGISEVGGVDGAVVIVVKVDRQSIPPMVPYVWASLDVFGAKTRWHTRPPVFLLGVARAISSGNTVCRPAREQQFDASHVHLSPPPFLTQLLTRALRFSHPPIPPAFFDASKADISSQMERTFIAL